MIGLSLSLCVKDVLNGDVAFGDIRYIVAGTSAGNLETFVEVLNGYVERHWKQAPAEGVRIALELYHAGRIHQPRLKKGDHCPVLQNEVRWVDSEDQIVWSDAPVRQSV